MTRTLALGFLVGLAIAASPGPMFFLVLRRTLARGWRSGLVSGFGVATGDATYAALAAFGVAAVTNILVGQRRWIGLAFVRIGCGCQVGFGPVVGGLDDRRVARARAADCAGHSRYRHRLRPRAGRFRRID